MWQEHTEQYTIKIRMHSSCEIEDRFRRSSSLHAMCDTPIARITVCVLSKDISLRLPFELACTRVNRVMLFTLCAETIKPAFEGGKSDGCRLHQFTMYIL